MGWAGGFEGGGEMGGRCVRYGRIGGRRDEDKGEVRESLSRQVKKNRKIMSYKRSPEKSFFLYS